MNRNDTQAEWAFYGKALDVVGHLYMPALSQPARYPDVLFFCFYTARLLVDKKVTLSAATEILKQLRLGPGLEKVARWDEDRLYTSPARVVTYKGYTKSAISASMMFRDKPHFRLGYMGFGLFSNGKRFDFCAVASVFVLLETLYLRHEKDRQTLDMLWRCAENLGKVELGARLNKGNWETAAKTIYQQVTEDDFPGLTK